VPEDVARWIAEHHPATRVLGFHHGFFTAAETDAVLEDIRRSGAVILLVAFGVPKQEKWIRDNLAQTGVSLAMGVGGLFDFYSGRIPRAPVWIREIGMEWLYRFAQEPRRMWRRYFVGNFIFLVRALSERFIAQRDLARREQARREQW
jgi:N-acetylglucosaminyldiphosphoundecaprenol N-acetyl-beta-D-mannosaminyltransferase